MKFREWLLRFEMNIRFQFRDKSLNFDVLLIKIKFIVCFNLTVITPTLSQDVKKTTTTDSWLWEVVMVDVWSMFKQFLWGMSGSGKS